MSAGAVDTIDIVVTPDVVGDIENNVVVYGEDYDPDTINNADSIITTVLPAADLELSLSALPLDPSMDDEVVLALDVSNLGPQTATGLVLDLPLPAGLIFSDAADAGYDAATGRWVVGDLSAGAAGSLTLTAVTARGTAEDTIRISARVAEVDQGDPVDPDRTADAELVVQPDADLSVSLALSTTSADVGDTLTWTVGVTNLGPSPAPGVTVTDSLPVGAVLLDWDADTGMYDGAGRWDVGSMGSGETSELRLRTVLQAGTGGLDFAGAAAVEASGVADLAAVNNRAERLVHVNGADLVLETYVDVEAPGEGDDVNITLSAANLGPDAAHAVTVTDTLPSGLTYVSHTPPGESVSLGAGGAYTWDVGTVEGPTPRVLFVRTSVDAGTTGSLLRHGAVVASAEQEDPAPGNNTAGNAVAVAGTDLALALTAGVATAAEGDTLEYVLTLENLGPRDGTGIAVRDSLGEGLLFLDVDPAADYDAASGIWQVGELASGASAALIVRAVVDERTGGSSLLHVARVAELDQVDPAADNDEGAASVAVVLPDEGRVLVASTALPDVSVRPLADAVPVLAVDMVNWSVSNDTLMSLAVVNAAVGEGSPAQMDDSWDGVEIWRRDFDSWNRLPVDPAEFSSSEARFDDLDLVLTPGDTLRLELRGRAGAAARDGDRLALRLDSADALTFTRTVSVDASWPLATDAGVVVDGFVAAQAVRYGIASGSIAPGETGRTVLDVVLPADGYAPHTLNELQVVNFGSARSGDDIASVRAWLDDDDGVVTPGVDVDLGEMVWTGDRWRLAGLDRIVAPGGVRVLVVIDAAAGAAGGASVQFGVPVGGIEFDLAGDGPLDEPLRNSETLFVSGTDRLYLAAVVQPWRSAYADDGLHQVLHLTATNTFDAPRTITGLNLACEIDSPWSDDPAVLSGVVAQLLLREDEGDDGVPGTADPILAASSLSGGTAVLGGFDWTVPPATTRHLFVDARLSQDSAADGDNVSVTIASAVDVQLDSESVISGDWPLDGGGGLVVDGMLAARVLSEPTGTRTASPGAADLLALDVVVPANGHADDVLEAFDVAVQGTADDGDLAGLKLWRDGGDGRFDAGSGQGDDVVLAPLFPRFGRWSAQDLAEPVGTDGLRLYVGLDLADDADDTDVVSLAVPVGGIVYASDGDGPIDEAIVSGGAITISTSVLHVSLGTDLSEIVTGQDVEVRLTVSNVGGIPLHDVSPGSLEILGDGTLDMVAGPLPASLVLDVGASGDFVWTRRAASIGEVIVRAGASGLDVDESVVASLPVDAPAVRIAEPAPELRLAALSQLPFAVNGGQTDVNALVLGLRHPGDESSADVKLDSMVIRLEDAEGAPVNAGGVLSRILARIDGELLLARDIEPETGAVLTLRPDAAPLVRSFDERVLTIGLEVAEHAAGAEFRLVVDDGALQASDAVAGGVVGVLLDEGDFPVHSELTRVVEGAPALAVAAGEPGTPQASRGQTDVVLANWLLENPGVLDLGAGIQLGVVVVDVVDADGAPLTDPSTVVRSLDLWYDGARLVRRDLDEGSASTVVLPLDTPLPIAAGTTAGIEIRADLRDDAPVGGYGLAVAAGTAWDARDANSGVPVAVNVTPAPLVTTAVAVVHPADVVRFGGRDEGLDVLTGGAADQKVLELEIRHPGDEVTAAVSVDTLVVRCLDTRRRPMAASQVLERVRIRAGDRAVGATVATASPDGLLRIALDGVGCAPGGRTLLDVNVDVRAESLVDTFLVEVGLDDLRVFDANLRSVVAVTPDVGTGFPLSTGAMSIRVAADELVIAVSDLMPATVAALGGDVPAIRLDLTNTAAPASGDLAINSLHVRGRMSVDGPDKLAGLVGRFVAVIDDEVWGESEALAPGDTSAVITGPVGLVVPPGRTEEVEIRFELVEGVESGSLTVGLGLGDIDVTQPEGDLVTVRVLPADGQTFPFWTLPGTVTPPSLEESYANFPNPFAAGSEATSFVFALRSESTVDLRVYTPRGELVRTLLSAERRDVGLHQDVAWDGRNGRGDTVRNGVYIAEIVVRASDGGTTTLRRKVAVVR